MSEIAYPRAMQAAGTRQFGAQRVADPYGWLADGSSAQTRHWLAAQDGLVERVIRARAEFDSAKAYLRSFPAAVPPCRVDAGEAAGFMPARYGNREFFIRRDADGNRVPFCQRHGTDEAVAIHVPEGTSGLFPSPSGRFVAFVDGLRCVAGIIDLDGPDTDPVRIENTCASHICWWPDERGMVINSFPPPVPGPRPGPSAAYRPSGLYYCDRKGGEVLRIVAGEPLAGSHPLVPLWIEDTRLWVGVQDYWSQEVRGLFWVDSQTLQRTVVVLEPGRHALVPVGSTGDRVFLVTSESRGHASLVCIRCGQDRGRVAELAVLRQGVPIRYIPGKPWGRMSALLGEHIYVVCFEHTQSTVHVFGLDGTHVGVLPLPAGSGVDGIFPCPDTGTLRIAVQSYLDPPVTLEFDGPADKQPARRSTPVQLDPGIEQMLSGCEQLDVFCPVADGERIPLTLVRSKSPRTQRPGLLLHVYGGFGNIWQPAFAADICLWLAAGGSYVHAHIRGDGVYGNAWHEAAAPKRNIAIADIAAVRDFLVAAGYTCADRIILQGESNGALMALAAMVRHPNKFAGVLASMPLADPIAHLFERDHPTLMRDFGDPQRNPDDLAYMLKWAPAYNLRGDSRYPPLFLAVGDCDSVILAQDSYRLVAQLQNPPHRSPLALLRVVRGHGHQRWFGETGQAVSAEMFVFARMACGQIGLEPAGG